MDNDIHKSNNISFSNKRFYYYLLILDNSPHFQVIIEYNQRH